jgi:hypothetical protein
MRRRAKDSAAAAPQIVTIPAISDAGGPDPRPYTYDMKPAEEAIYRSKMLDLAATLVRASARRQRCRSHAQEIRGQIAGKSTRQAGKPPKPASTT